MDFAAKGAAALSEKDFLAALTFYTKALIDHPSSPDYFTQRSIAFSRLSPPRHDLALKDAEYAVLLGQKRAKREKIQAAQQRRVVALHGLGRYADAKAILETTERWRPQDSKPAKMEWDMWMARIENKLKGVPESERVSTEKEYPEIELPSETKMKAWLQSQLKADGSFKFEGDAESESGSKSKETESASTGTVGSTDGTNGSGSGSGSARSAEPQTAVPSIPTKIRHEWYQSPQTVTITLYVKAVPKDKCEIDVHEDSVHISFPLPSNPSSTYSFVLDPLFALIDPSQSKAAVLSTKVELTLKKAQPGQKWHNLEGTTPLKPSASDTTMPDADHAASTAVMSTLANIPSAQAPSSTTPKETAPAYPTSSRTGPKNWDKLADDLVAKTKAKGKGKTHAHTQAKGKGESKQQNPDPEQSTSSEEKEKTKSDDTASKDDGSSDSDADDAYDSDMGGDAVDGFFKKLYAGADDDTRRAMMKSFYESNGTALSTNWKDVGARHVDEVKSSSHD
ncbi:SGT1 and CS domain protein [Cladophialophora carrionii]|uniref:SGT1 and CS domain protein n=1 Tax=Cladophialophora carrionii TaxID=86049 RepID=A0A1C1CBF5_9EURO|nr:SGT1 and CS domain protein [Cladophialophora carrionii]